MILAFGVTAGCSALQVQSSQVQSEQGWLTEGESAQRTNATDSPLAPPLELRWELNANAGFGMISPIIVDQVVFVANRKGEVHAIELETGRRVGRSSFGESIEGTPLYENGSLYIPVGWGRSSLVAQNLMRGTARWKIPGASISSGLLSFADVIIAADDEGYVRAHRKSDGKLDWSTSLGDGIGISASPILAAGRVVVAGDRGEIAALNAIDGSAEWSIELGTPVLSTPSTDDESIYVATTRGRFVKLRAEDGSEEWSFGGPDSTVYLTSPAVDGDHVVFGASDGQVRAIGASSGRELWSSNVDAAVTAPPLLAEEFVFVGTMKSMLFALDRNTGAEVWRYELDGRMKSAFAAKGGMLVVLAEPRSVYLFESPTESYARGNE